MVTIKKYAGCVYFIKKKNAWKCEVVASIDNKTKTYTKQLSVNKFQNPEQAKNAIENYRRELSDNLGLTTDYEVPLKEQGKIMSEEFQQYIAGFFDGDGCCTVNNDRPVVHFTQAQNYGVPTILIKIKLWYGGSICKQSRFKNRRDTYKLIINQKQQFSNFVGDIKQTAILKRNQLEYYSSVIGKKYDLTDIKMELSKMRQNYSKVSIPLEKLTLSYISGLFDAEGCILLQNGLQIEFAQKSNLEILKKISKIYGDDRKPYGGQLRLTGDSARSLLVKMLPHLIVKKNQAECVLEYLQSLDEKKRDRKENWKKGITII